MKRMTRFWTVLLGAPSSKVLFAFAIGVLVMALLGNLYYDALMGEVTRARPAYPDRRGAQHRPGIPLVLSRLSAPGDQRQCR